MLVTLSFSNTSRARSCRRGPRHLRLGHAVRAQTLDRFEQRRLERGSATPSIAVSASV